MAETVSFHPTKTLFIDVLTRDISIRDCIFDLLDNAADSYTRHGISDMRQVQISFDDDHFEIKDYCGGVGKKQLLEEVFRFGLIDLSVQAKTIGVYGIGLKRSIFKIGKNILLETDDGNDYCRLRIDVDEWMKDEENWDLPLTDTSSSRLNGNKPYTYINITNLRDEAKDLFVSSLFESSLKENASIYYSWFINAKEIELIINEEKLLGYEITIKESDDYKPVKYQETYDDIDIEIICWLDISDVEEKRKRRERFENGWNVYMNKRLVMFGDTSSSTGWKGQRPYLPQYHPIYNQFKGIVFLSTNEPYNLPVNTRKNGFDTESKTYQHLLMRMCEVARPLVDYLSDKYERSQRRMDNTEATVVKDIQEDTDEQKSKHLKESTLTEAEYVSKFVPPKIEEKPRVVETSIQYRKEKRRVDLVKQILDVSSNWEAGSETFEYFWDAEGLDDIKQT